MQALTEERIKLLSDLFSLIETKYPSKGVTQWYRGCGKITYSLLPGLYRHPAISDVKSLVENEYSIMCMFVHRSFPFLEQKLEIGFDGMFVGQHYGVPTRLLDWTENPFIALYFSLISALENSHYTTPSEDAAMWILYPVEWNKHALRNQAFDKILGVNDDPLSGYSLTKDSSKLNLYPAALYGLHNSHRIVAQRGSFTIFGKDNRAMEKIYTDDDFPKNSLIKIIIDKNDISTLLEQIINIGITDSVVFPDLDGLAKELKRKYGFRVG